MEIGKMLYYVFIFISAVILSASCDENKVQGLNEKYVNSDEVDSIFDLRSDKSQRG